MSLFLFFANLNVERKAGKQLAETEDNPRSRYWRKRFEQFNIDHLVESPPRGKSKSLDVLQEIRSNWHNIIGRDPSKQDA